MVRGMKVLLCFVAFLLCLGAKISNANSGKSVESKRKFISISNKAKDEAVIECKSEKQNLNKTLKPGEKIRWGLVGETTICHVDVGSKGVHGYVRAFVEKECKWRVLDDGVLKLKGAGGEWKSFELKADEEGARNYDEHHSCDNEDEDDDDVGKGKGGSGETRSLEPAPSPSPNEEGKGVQRNSGKSRPRNSESAAIAPTKSMAPQTTKKVKKAKAPKKHGRRKMKPGRHPAPATPKSWKKKPRAPVAPPPLKMKHAQGRPRSSNNNNYYYYSRSPAPTPIAVVPTKSTKKAAPPMKQGHRKMKPRHPRAVPVQASAPAPVAISPTKEEIMTPSENNAPTPTTKSPHANANFPKWKAPAPAPADWTTKSAPPPTQESGGPDAPLPRPGSTFYTCIKEEDSR